MKLTLSVLVAAFAAWPSHAENINLFLLAGQDPLSKEIFSREITSYKRADSGETVKLPNIPDVLALTGIKPIPLAPLGNIKTGLSPVTGLKPEKKTTRAKKKKIKPAAEQLRALEKQPKEFRL
ncbi:MAG: hypothetical protein A3J74_08100 [Elusimicrobia bacterium RIFCSPHIGHO2_02_FULL_57_9]|nr:MAG: hypothetical protein A3J74_08100 [Elusimicrobia bacterium RIFCSPHIGHO2_02_FULL_57_9]